MQSLAIAIATVGGVGRIPFASGTFGSLVAVPLLPPLGALRTASLTAYVTVVCVLIAVAVWAAGRTDEALGAHDHSRIVIDEVAGLVVAGAFVPGTWPAAALAFFLFRFFDVVKPFPAGLIDARVQGGLGVVGDDLVAGVYAGVATALLLKVV